MRKNTTANGTFYYPEEYVSLVDTDELKIIVENPEGYVEGDLVRLFYTSASDDVQAWVNTFEMFSPLVKDGPILRAIFYLPLSAEFANDSISFNPHLQSTAYFIKTKGATDFLVNRNILDSNASYFYLTTINTGVRSHPIPVFFFSERGAGLFENTILNRQRRVADTNFSSVAIRQDRFNPYVMDVGGRNLLREGILRGYIARALEKTGTHSGIPVFKDPSGSGRIGWEYITPIPIAISTGGWMTLSFKVFFRVLDGPTPMDGYVRMSNSDGTTTDYNYGQGLPDFRLPENRNKWIDIKYSFQLTKSVVAVNRLYFFAAVVTADADYTMPKFEEGSIATAWTPAPEDYEVTEVVSGADLAGGLAKFNSSYAFKLLDDSEWVTKKLICPENYIQLFWGEPRTETRFSFWFEIKEIEKSSEAWGEVERYRELRAGTDVKERRKDVTKYRFPKTKLRLTSGVFRQDIIDKLKGIVHSTTIYKYNPYTKLNEGRGVIAQVTEIRDEEEIPTTQEGVGHFRLNDIFTYSNTIEELIDSPESVFDLEFSFKGQLRSVHFIQNRDDEANNILISGSITESNFTKKTFNGSITIDRSRIVKPALRFRISAATPTEIKDIFIKGSLGGIEDVEVEIATMNIIPHQDGESEMELTVISDDFRKPDYLYF